MRDTQIVTAQALSEKAPMMTLSLEGEQRTLYIAIPFEPGKGSVVRVRTPDRVRTLALPLAEPEATGSLRLFLASLYPNAFRPKLSLEKRHQALSTADHLWSHLSSALVEASSEHPLPPIPLPGRFIGRERDINVIPNTYCPLNLEAQRL